MPKNINRRAKARAVPLVHDHRGEYSSLTAPAAVVAKQLGVARSPCVAWYSSPKPSAVSRAGASTEELAEIKRLKAENKRLREDVEILRGAA